MRLSSKRLKQLIRVRIRQEAVDHLESARARLQRSIERVNNRIARLTGRPASNRGRKRGKLSPAGRAAIRKAQKARWAKYHRKQKAPAGG